MKSLSRSLGSTSCDPLVRGHVGPIVVQEAAHVEHLPGALPGVEPGFNGLTYGKIWENMGKYGKILTGNHRFSHEIYRMFL